MIDFLEKGKASSPNVGLAYVYCDYRDQIQQTTKSIIGAILKQLLRQIPSIPKEIAAFLEKHCNETEPFELSQALEALHTACKSFSRIFICLDALDECQDMHKLLDSLEQVPSTVHLFSTGREHVQHIVRQHFEHSQTIHIEAKESDIRILIEETINEDRKKDPSLMNETLEHDITQKISTLSKGMFVIT